MLPAATAWTFSLLLAAAAASGEPLCLGCHGDVGSAEGAPHPLAPAEAGAPQCTDCHRDAEAHVSGGGVRPSPMMAFAREDAAARSSVCLTCHREARPTHGTSAHGQAGVACNDCHRVHGERSADPVPLPAGFDAVDAASAGCADCHAAVFARFAFNERHRLAEGALSCVSCHDPHGRPERALLAHDSGSPCGDCHRQVTGPFVFEHGASRVEGCEACHDPHGSPNRHLLTHQRVGELCYSCHAAVPQFHIGFAPGAPARFGQDTVCTNCHTAIHGSNFDRNFLR